jgi:HEAT repeat protein
VNSLASFVFLASARALSRAAVLYILLDALIAFVTNGLKKTCEVLASTRNRAVLPTLAAALRSSSASVRGDAIRAIVRRHDSESHRVLIAHFDNLQEGERTTLREIHRAMPHHMARALKAAVLGRDPKLCKHACQIIALCDDYDLFPALVEAAENRKLPGSSDAIASLLQLASDLDAELASWHGEHPAGKGHSRDPSFARRHVLAALERSLANYARHECRELIEAFVLLAPSDNPLLQKILHDPLHACYTPVAAALASGTAPGVVARLVRLLCDTDAPDAVLRAIATRTDPEFIHALFAVLKAPLPLRALHNMKRLSRVAWLEDNSTVLLELSGRSQGMAVELAAASSITSDALFRLLALMMDKGLTEGRRASCRALAKFERPEATIRVVHALNDPDVGVRAAAIRQLRPRAVPNALQTLVALLDSRSQEIRDAARSSLAEFNFARYRSMFDLLDDSAARTTGVLVHKVDTDARDGLIEELTSPCVASRLRAVEMAVAMEATQDVCDLLIDLSRHENAALRREAVSALAQCLGAKAENAIRMAVDDAHQGVRDAARVALEHIHAGRKTTYPAVTVREGAI